MALGGLTQVSSRERAPSFHSPWTIDWGSGSAKLAATVWIYELEMPFALRRRA